ncbi:MAG: beta strand repeat-containing protein, partial [bacterium]
MNATLSGNVLIQTLGAGVNLGNGTDTTSNLGLSQAELNNITAGTLVINSNTGSIVNTASISRANATLGTNLTLISGNSITQSGGNMTIAGTANFVSLGSGNNGNITLGNITNGFLGTVTANGTNLTIWDAVPTKAAGNITLGDIRATGFLDVKTPNGTITQGLGTVIVGGTTSLLATGNVTMNMAGNNFAGVITANGTNITIVNVNATALGTVTASGDLTVRSTGGAVTQSGGYLSSTGTANFVTTSPGPNGNITLGNTSNDFNILTACGTNLTLAELNNVTLNNLAISGTVNITAANAATISGSFSPANTVVSGGTVLANGLLTTNLTVAGGAANIQTGGNVTGAAVLSSGNLTSNGAFGSLTLNGGTLYTTSTGTVVRGALAFNNGSVWNASGANKNDFSRINANGAVTIQSAANLTLTAPGSANLLYSEGLTLINNTGGSNISQTTGFANLPQNTIFTSN